jgi:hypothetical protein
MWTVTYKQTVRLAIHYDPHVTHCNFLAKRGHVVQKVSVYKDIESSRVQTTPWLIFMHCDSKCTDFHFLQDVKHLHKTDFQKIDSSHMRCLRGRMIIIIHDVSVVAPILCPGDCVSL